MEDIDGGLAGKNKCLMMLLLATSMWCAVVALLILEIAMLSTLAAARPDFISAYIKVFVLVKGQFRQEITTFRIKFRHSIVASIPACHAGDRGSIPRVGDFFVESLMVCRYHCIGSFPK